MQLKKKILTAAALVVGTVALAHHLPMALSSALGPEIVPHVEFMTGGHQPGIPPYIVGADEHHLALVPGMSFSVTDQDGKTQQVVFQASQFQDIGEATPQEVVDAINKQITIAKAEVINNTATMRGLLGGASAQLQLAESAGDGSPSVLEILDFTAQPVAGSDDIELQLSIPLDDDPNSLLVNLPYLMVASTTAGTTPIAGFELPLVPDLTTEAVLRATQLGLLPGFLSQLDGNADAKATFPAQWLPKLFASGYPEQFHFAYVVFKADLSGVAYVSNLFTVEFVDG